MIVKGKRLTDPYVQRIKAPASAGQQDEYFDALISGLAVRIGTSGVRTFVYLYRYNGKSRRMTLGRYDKETFTLENARDAAWEARSQVKKGHDPALQRKLTRKKVMDAPTVREIADEYLEKHAKRKKRSWQEDERILNKDILTAWGDAKAADVKRADVVALLDDIVARGSPVAANRTLAVISRMYNFAVERSRLEISPAWKVKAPHTEQSRERALTEDEIKTLWSNLPNARMSEGTRIAIKLILVTGQRPGEITGIHQRELTKDLWTLPGKRAKNKMAHTIPLSKLAQELIGDAHALIRPKDGEPTISGYLFPSPLATSQNDRPIAQAAMGRAVYDNLDVLGIEKFTPHDLRRTAMTMMGKIGVSRFVQDRVANLKDTTMGGIYDRYAYDQKKRQALDKWARELERIINGTATAKVVSLHG